MVEGLLWVSGRFCWLPKGYAVLLAVATVGVVLLAMLLWFVVALLSRLRFQFSIRTLLVLTVAVAIPCSWLAVEMKRAREQKQAVASLRKLGFNVGYDLRIVRRGNIIVAQKDKPAWLLRLLGDDFVYDIEHVFFKRHAKDAHLEQLAVFRRLKSVSLDNSHVTDSGLAYITGLTELHELSLRLTGITDSGLAELTGLPNLDNLQLDDTQLTDIGLAQIKNMAHLRVLSVNGTCVSDVGLAELAGLPNLQFLSLRKTLITDKGLKHLRTLPRLSFLDLTETRVTDGGIAGLKELTQLQELRLHGTEVTDAGIRKLQQALPNRQISN